MKPSRLYEESREATNEWLVENAPHYVISNLNEVADIMKRQHARIVELEGHIAEITKGVEEMGDIIQEELNRPWWKFWK